MILIHHILTVAKLLGLKLLVKRTVPGLHNNINLLTMKLVISIYDSWKLQFTQFTIPLQQLQSNGSVADLYSFNRLSRVFVTHPRDFLKNLGHFIGFYRTSIIVPSIMPRIRGENV